MGCAGARLICGCWRDDGLPACFLAVPLSRLRSFAIPWGFACGARCLTILSVLFRHRFVVRPASFNVFKAFQSVRFSIQSSIGCVRRYHVIHPIGFALSLFTRSAIFLVVLFLAYGRMARCRGSAFRFPCRLAARPPFSVSPFRPSARRTGRDVMCAVSSIKRRGCR